MRFVALLAIVCVATTTIFADRKPVDRSDPWEMMFHPGEIGRMLGEAVEANEQARQEAKDSSTEAMEDNSSSK